MTELDEVANKIFEILKGARLKIKLFDSAGAEVTDPYAGRRFFVVTPNIMITLNESDDADTSIDFNKGKDVNNSEIISKLQKNIRNLANEYQMNSSVNVYGKSIQPRDYAYRVKMKKDTMMENGEMNVNSLLMGKIVHFMETDVGSAYKLSKAIPGSNLADIQKSLNKLVQDGKIEAFDQINGMPIYRQIIAKATAFMENDANLQQVMKYSAVKGQDNRALSREKARTNSPIPKVDKFAFPAKPPAKVKRKPITAIGGNSIDESITESFSRMFGSSKTSQQTLENIRILVKHKTAVDEAVRGARSRHIGAIFLESNGERFRFQYNYLPGARAMAQHMAHGGTMLDKVGAYITESTGQLLKLQSFTRYVNTNKLVNESTLGIVDTVKENIQTLRTELTKIIGTKTYETVKARVTTFNREPLSEDDTSQLKDMFTIRRFDEKFDEVLPIVKQLVQEKDTYHKRIEESAASIIKLQRSNVTAAILEFASDNARLGYKINELALRITENTELAGFINKIGTKISKEGKINAFEQAVMLHVFENITIVTPAIRSDHSTVKESVSFERYFDRFGIML